MNPDELVLKEFGHTALTETEALRGQRLAEDRRQQLFAEHKSILTETTFSYPSKINLILQAKALNYEILLYHINVQSAELSVARVEHRVQDGGHSVPEDKIRNRYLRNQALIRQAVDLANRAYIFDNTALGKTPILTIIFKCGKIIWIKDKIPDWVALIYKEEVCHFPLNNH